MKVWRDTAWATSVEPWAFVSMPGGRVPAVRLTVTRVAVGGTRITNHSGESAGMTTPVHCRNWAHRLAIAACVLVVQGEASAAQRQTAVLEGTVQDSTGAVVAAADVTIRDAATNLTRTVQTDALGTFRFSDLPVATYEVRVASDGFTPYTHAGVTLAIRQTARMLIVLHPAGVVEEVSVSAQPPPLDARQTSVATAIDTERIE